MSSYRSGSVESSHFYQGIHPRIEFVVTLALRRVELYRGDAW